MVLNRGDVADAVRVRRGRQAQESLYPDVSLQPLENIFCTARRALGWNGECDLPLWCHRAHVLGGV